MTTTLAVQLSYTGSLPHLAHTNTCTHTHTQTHTHTCEHSQTSTHIHIPSRHTCIHTHTHTHTQTSTHKYTLLYIQHKNTNKLIETQRPKHKQTITIDIFPLQTHARACIHTQTICPSTEGCYGTRHGGCLGDWGGDAEEVAQADCHSCIMMSCCDAALESAHERTSVQNKAPPTGTRETYAGRTAYDIWRSDWLNSTQLCQAPGLA